MFWKLPKELRQSVRTVTLLLAVLLLLQHNPGGVRAAVLNNRSVLISTSEPSATTIHAFTFDIATAGTLGSIEFEYCSNSPLFGTACVAPAGLDLTGAVLATQTGQTGFSIHGSSTINKLILSRAPAAAGTGSVSYTFNNVINPSTISQSTYIRISTYASNNATGAHTDEGGVVFATTGGIGVGGFVPPYLIFCAGIVVAPDCSSSTGFGIDLGELSKTSPKTATTEVNGATNSVTGIVVSVLGTTMTSGNNIIPALAAPTANQVGTSQFGINLRANNNPLVGQDTSGLGTDFPAANYNIPNRFTFIPGDTIATSSLSTNYNILTISYLVNVSAAQAPGLYSTTLTYVGTVQF